MKKSQLVAVSVLVVVVASGTAFGIFNTNSIINAKPNQASSSNYLAGINSLKPQINSINDSLSSLSTNMPSLGTVKSDMAEIKGKLSDIETKISQEQQVVSTQASPVIIYNKSATTSITPVIILDRSTYFPGDVIHITVFGVERQSIIHIQLVDSSGFAVMKRDALADNTGGLVYDFPLSYTLIPGNWQIRLIVGQEIVFQPIVIMNQVQTAGSVSSDSSYLFTAQTDKGVYQTSDTIEVFGIGEPNTTVTATLTSPLGHEFASEITTRADGTFALFYTNPPSHETGNWHVTVNNQGLTRILYFTIVSSEPSFTAQTFKNIYHNGDLIRISGTAQPYSTINAVLTSPLGTTYTASTTSNPDGSYLLSYFTSPWYQAGNWSVTVTNQGLARVIPILLEP